MSVQNKQTFKPELNKILADLIRYIPNTGGNIQVDVDSDPDDKSRSYIVHLPPSMFMANYTPHNPKLKIEKREFWDSECHEHIASLEIRGNPKIEVTSTLVDTLPREYKYLSERR